MSEKQTTNALALPTGVASLVSAQDVKSIQAALPRTLRKHAGDFLRVALIDIPRNYKLAEAAKANPKSAIACILDAARLGLQFGPLGHVYLVPYKVKGEPVVQLQIGYRGLEELARRSGQVSAIYSQVVYKGDEWRFEPLDEKPIHHVPAADVEHVKPNAIGAYAAARLKDGTIQSEYMTVAEVEAIRKRSRSGDDGPWITDWPEMARKTVLRRLCKHLPMSVEASAVVAAADEPEFGFAGDVAQPPTLDPAARAVSYADEPAPHEEGITPKPVEPEVPGDLGV